MNYSRISAIYISFFIVMGTIAVPTDAHAGSIWEDIKRFFHIKKDYQLVTPTAVASARTPTAVVSARGSEAEITTNPDGSETWAIIDGKFHFTLRDTIDTFTLLSGDSYTFAAPISSIYPIEYSSMFPPGSDDFLFYTTFQNISSSDIFNLNVQLTSSDPDFNIINDSFLLGHIIGDSIIQTSMPTLINDWNPSKALSHLSWILEYDDSLGVHYRHENIPTLHNVQTSYSVPEPSTFLILATGVLLLLPGVKKGIRS